MGGDYERAKRAFQISFSFLHIPIKGWRFRYHGAKNDAADGRLMYHRVKIAIQASALFLFELLRFFGLNGYCRFT